jgi:hypothetical protein
LTSAIVLAPAAKTDPRRSRAGVNCAPIPGPDANDGDATYTLTAADQGFRIRSRVTASNTLGFRSKNSHASAVIASAAST